MNKKQLANALISLVAVMIFVYGLSRIAGAPDIVSLFSPEVEISSAAAALEDTVTLDDFELNINQVTKQVKAVFKLSNRAKITISDMSIVCDLYDANGGSWGRGRWKIYADLPANGSETYVLTDRRFISYHVRAEQSRCRIVDVKRSGKVEISAAGDH